MPQHKQLFLMDYQKQPLHNSESSFSSSQTHLNTFSTSNQTSTSTNYIDTHFSKCSYFASKLGQIFSYQDYSFDPLSHVNINSTSLNDHINVEYCSDPLFMASLGGLIRSIHHQRPSEDHNTTKKKFSGQRKREELEREVSKLQEMLNQEEKVHEILQHVLNQHNGPVLNIPNFLPPKMKELLGELAMVEGEIVRLEGQISELKIGLKHEQESIEESKYKQWRQGIQSSPKISQLSNVATFPSPMNNIGVHDRMGFETKALHFISKAIKGDYNNLNDHFGPNEKKVDFRGLGDHKENYFHEDKPQDKFPRKSEILFKPASPFRDPRYPSSRFQPRERNAITSDLPPKSVSIPVHSEETTQNWQPNKLSEEILKCLNFIYIRLLRTTRQMELEKSGPISRSLHSSLSSRSFRADIGPNSKPNLLSQKESRQQDPYGVFDTEESILRDIGPYKNLVIFTSSSMDPKCLSNTSSIPLWKKLRVLMNDLQIVNLNDLTYQQKLAFWINIYNACVMHGFIQFGVPSSQEKLLTLLNKATVNIGGNLIDAQAIENYILRKPSYFNLKETQRKSDMDNKEAIIRGLYGLELIDPNVTFALCSGTRSSPAVRIYTGDGVIAELEKSKLEYLQASIVVTCNKKISFPELLLKNMYDFAVDKDSLIEWVCQQLPTSGSLRKSMVDCFRGLNSGKISSVVEKITYDFEFQYLLAISA